MNTAEEAQILYDISPTLNSTLIKVAQINDI